MFDFEIIDVWQMCVYDVEKKNYLLYICVCVCEWEIIEKERFEEQQKKKKKGLYDIYSSKLHLRSKTMTGWCFFHHV